MKEKLKALETEIIVKNVVLGSNDLFQPKMFNSATNKYDIVPAESGKLYANLLFDKVKHKEEIDRILLAFDTMAESLWKQFKWDKAILKGYSSESRMADGDKETYNKAGQLKLHPETVGKYVLRLTSKPSLLTLINQRKERVAESDNLFYAGCEINCRFTILPYEQRGITTYMNVIQFAKHAEPIKFGNSGDISEFDEIEDEDALGL